MSDDRLYLLHIQECIERVEQYTAGGRPAFFADIRTQDAVLRNLQVMAESTQRISAAIKATQPGIDWRGIAGFRNVLTHAYLGVDLNRVWAIIETDLPPLKTAVGQMLLIV